MSTSSETEAGPSAPQKEFVEALIRNLGTDTIAIYGSSVGKKELLEALLQEKGERRQRGKEVQAREIYGKSLVYSDNLDMHPPDAYVEGFRDYSKELKQVRELAKKVAEARGYHFHKREITRSFLELTFADTKKPEPSKVIGIRMVEPDEIDEMPVQAGKLVDPKGVVERTIAAIAADKRPDDDDILAIREEVINAINLDICDAGSQLTALARLNACLLVGERTAMGRAVGDGANMVGFREAAMKVVASWGTLEVPPPVETLSPAGFFDYYRIQCDAYKRQFTQSDGSLQLGFSDPSLQQSMSSSLGPAMFNFKLQDLSEDMQQAYARVVRKTIDDCFVALYMSDEQFETWLSSNYVAAMMTTAAQKKFESRVFLAKPNAISGPFKASRVIFATNSPFNSFCMTIYHLLMMRVPHITDWDSNIVVAFNASPSGGYVARLLGWMNQAVKLKGWCVAVYSDNVYIGTGGPGGLEWFYSVDGEKMEACLPHDLLTRIFAQLLEKKGVADFFDAAQRDLLTGEPPVKFQTARRLARIVRRFCFESNSVFGGDTIKLPMQKSGTTFTFMWNTLAMLLVASLVENAVVGGELHFETLARAALVEYGVSITLEKTVRHGTTPIAELDFLGADLVTHVLSYTKFDGTVLTVTGAFPFLQRDRMGKAVAFVKKGWAKEGSLNAVSLSISVIGANVSMLLAGGVLSRWNRQLMYSTILFQRAKLDDLVGGGSHILQGVIEHIDDLQGFDSKELDLQLKRCIQSAIAGDLPTISDYIRIYSPTPRLLAFMAAVTADLVEGITDLETLAELVHWVPITELANLGNAVASRYSTKMKILSTAPEAGLHSMMSTMERNSWAEEDAGVNAALRIVRSHTSERSQMMTPEEDMNLATGRTVSDLELIEEAVGNLPLKPIYMLIFENGEQRKGVCVNSLDVRLPKFITSIATRSAERFVTMAQQYMFVLIWAFILRHVKSRVSGLRTRTYLLRVAAKSPNMNVRALISPMALLPAGLPAQPVTSATTWLSESSKINGFLSSAEVKFKDLKPAPMPIFKAQKTVSKAIINEEITRKQVNALSFKEEVDGTFSAEIVGAIDTYVKWQEGKKSTKGAIGLMEPIIISRSDGILSRVCVADDDVEEPPPSRNCWSVADIMVHVAQATVV
jgi:hypothetical protein